MKASVFIATSLDGFIAREDGSLDWLIGEDGDQSQQEDSQENEEGEDYGFADHWQRIDTLVLGRHTFDWVINYGQWPYEGKNVVVLSSGIPYIPDELKEQVQVMSGTPQEIVDKLADQGAEHLYIDGGKTIQAFLRAQLIDDMVINVLPVLIGQGIPLFGSLENDIWLDLKESKVFENGYILNRYVPLYEK